MTKFGLLFLGAIAFSSPSLAEEIDNQSGVFFGGGFATTVNIDDSDYDSSGYALEVGYDFNKVFGLEYKYLKTENDLYDFVTNTASYFGANIGHDFNTGWFRLYGKVGLYDLETEVDWGNGDRETWDDSSVAIGVGVRFASGDPRGFYLKIEVLSTEAQNDSIGVGSLLAGFHF